MSEKRVRVRVDRQGLERDPVRELRGWCRLLLDEGRMIEAMSARDLALQVLAITDATDSAGRPTDPRRR